MPLKTGDHLWQGAKWPGPPPGLPAQHTDDDASFCQGSRVRHRRTGRAGTRRPPPRRGWWCSSSPWSSRSSPPPRCCLVPRGKKLVAGDRSPMPSAGATVNVSPSPALGRYLAGAVGAKADRLAAIGEDGSVEPIADFSDEQIQQIVYSPDGARLACVAGTYERSELWLFDAATGDARQVTADTPNVLAVDSIAWLSATELLVAGYTEPPKATGQNADLLVYDTAAQEFSPLLDAGGVSLRGVAVSASREGAEVAFVTYTDVKTGQYGMVTATERLEVLDRASGRVTELGREQGLLRRQRARVRRAAHLPERRGDHLPARRQRRRHQLHGRRRRRDRTHAGQGDAVPGRLRLGPGRDEGRLHGVPPGRFGRMTFWVFDTEARRQAGRPGEAQGRLRPGPLLVARTGRPSPGPRTTRRSTGPAPSTSRRPAAAIDGVRRAGAVAGLGAERGALAADLAEPMT